MSRSLTLALAGVLSAAVAGSAVFTGGASAVERVDGLEGPRGFDIGATGKTVVAEADGTISRAFRFGPRAGTVKKIAGLPGEFIAPAVAVGPDNVVWVLTSGGESDTSGTLFRKEPGAKLQKVRNIQRWVRRNHADKSDLEGDSRDSNPYGVAAGPGSTALVADAANNSVLKVWPGGRTRVVARVKPRITPVPEEMQSGDEPLPPQLPSEAVTTSVTMGPDGSVYIGELRGFPGTPGYSQIWRVRPGAMRALCDPETPRKGTCKRYVDGLTSVVALDTGRGGSLYAAELSKDGWLAAESGSVEGAIIRIGHDRNVRRELGAGKVILPGAVAVGGRGNVFTDGPIFSDAGPGSIVRVR
ncbi:MAG: ScyD/ScyE family protein [Nocardioides sp.]